MKVSEVINALGEGKKLTIQHNPEKAKGWMGLDLNMYDFEFYEEPTTDCEFIIDRETFYKNATEIAKCTKHAKDNPNCELNKNSEPEPKFKVGDRIKVLFKNKIDNLGKIEKDLDNLGWYKIELDKGSSVNAREKDLEKVEEEKTNIPPMPVKEITQEEFKKRYPDVEKEEWTYPCVVQHKETEEVRIALYKTYIKDFDFVLNRGEFGYKKDFKVIATDLRNLDL